MKTQTSNRWKNITLIFSIFVAILFYFCISNSNANSDVTESGMQEFTIKKVDDSGNPLPDVEFSIIGDPKVEVEDYYSETVDWNEKLDESDRKLLSLYLEDNVFKLKNPIKLKFHEEDDEVDIQGQVIYSVDLTKEIYDYTLNIKGQLNNQSTNSESTYAEITIVTNDDNENKDEQKIDNTSSSVNFERVLKSGEKYSVIITFYSTDDNEENSFIINEINLKAKENTYKTDKNGEIKQKFNDGSNLRIDEVKPLDGYYKAKGYQVDDNYYSFDKKFSISKSHKNEITVVNPKYRDLIIDKVDDAGNPVSNVTFNIDSEYVGDPKINIGDYYFKDGGKIISNSKSEYVYELDEPIVLTAETEFKTKEESKEEEKKEENPEFELLNYHVEYDIDLTNEKLNYDLILNASLDNKKPECNSYAMIKLDGKEMQRIDKNSSNVDFKTKLASGKKYKLGVYFYDDNCIDGCLMYKVGKEEKNKGKILNADYIGNTVTIKSITLKTDNLYKTDKDGKIKISVLNGDKIHLKEIETPYGYKKADGYFVGDEYHDFNETYVVNSKEDQIDIKVVNDRIKRKVIVNHYLKGTDKKVAESEEIEYPILEEYTTNGHTDLTGLTFEKNEAGEDIFPSNANGVVDDKDYDTPIVVDYYYEPQDIEITIHHYKEGTNEKLAEDEVLNIPVNLVPDENGIYRAENQTVKYVLESNENYKDLIKKYNLTDITSTIDPDLTIKDYLESGKSFEISYYYNDKKLKDDDNNADNKVDNNKVDNKVDNNKADNKEKDNDIGKNEETDGDLSLPDILENKINEIFEGIKTGDNILIYIIVILISSAIILKLKMNKNKKKNRKKSK